MWRKLHFFIILEESLQCPFVMHVYPLLVDEVNEIWVWKGCLKGVSNLNAQKTKSAYSWREAHVLLYTSFDLIPLLLPSVISGSEPWLRKRVKTEEDQEGDMAGSQGREWSESTGQKGNTVDVSSQPWGRLWLMFTRFIPLPRLLSLSWSWSISRWSCGGSQCGHCRLSSWSPW